VLGLYYMTRERPDAKGAGKRFGSFQDVRMAFDHGEVGLHAPISVRMDAQRLETTSAGFFCTRSSGADFVRGSEPGDEKKELGNLIDVAYREAGNKATVIFADKLKDLGFEYATRAGISIAIKDMIIPARKTKLLDQARLDVREIEDQHNKGLITDGERYNKVVDIWAEVTDRVADEMLREIKTESISDEKGHRAEVSSFNPIHMMADSGARGSASRCASWRGCGGSWRSPRRDHRDADHRELPEGLTVLQYFISTHGRARDWPIRRSRPRTPVT